MDANILLFGAPISSLTIIHYVEQVTGPPKYRYEKDFPGKIISGQSEKLCSFSMHVRPLGANLNYDFSRLESDLINAPILRKAAKTAYFSWLNSTKLVEYWGNRLADDPFYFLDEASRSFFERATDNGKKRVELKEFEHV